MIPRYTPAFPSFAPRPEENGELQWRERLLATLVGTGTGWHDFAFSELRHALHAYFKGLHASGPRDVVLMSAQICPVVALSARAAGLRPRFVDIAACAPTPEAAQYLATMDTDVAAVVVAPFYGHLAGDLDVLATRLGDARLVLDLAQGIGLGERAAALVARADAVGFSFGLGKGVDVGGGLLLARRALSRPTPIARLNRWSALRPAALRLVIECGLYSLIPRETVERSASPDAFSPDPAAGPGQPDYAGWSRALDEFVRSVALARTRARLLAGAGMAALVECREVCFDPAATHLRQLVRLKSEAARDALLDDLRRAGIDCAPGGELLPHEYLEGAPAGSAFPNAIRFKGESIRLPFLGRLSDSGFARLQAALETGLGRLPH
jgi:dTDP-4-amino-4,6-dideoxygalactose transaminase